MKKLLLVLLVVAQYAYSADGSEITEAQKKYVGLFVNSARLCEPIFI